MRRFANSLLFRVAALFFLGLVALQIAILATVLWPDGRPMVLRLIDPQDVREIAEAVEHAAPPERPLIVAAASNGSITAELLDGFPDDATDNNLRSAPRLETRFRRYAAALGDRPLRLQVREGGFLVSILRAEAGRGPVRLLVGLKDGHVLAVERAPLVLQVLASRYFAVALVAAAIIMALLATLLWQVVRPVRRLVSATEAFRDDVDAPDAELGGAIEVQALAAAFNSMKRRIGGLVGERTQMLAAIAHDLRTYLTRLRLRADHIPDPGQRERAVRDVEEMGQLLDDILMFARAEVKQGAGADIIDARAAAADYVRMRQEAGDDVGFAVGDEPLLCRCAPLAFRRILANLVDNAIRYGTRARIVLRQDGKEVVLTVTDDGPGVPPALIAQLTAPFERIEPSRGRHSGGVGLGLSIVKALAATHGGAIDIENRATGGLRVLVRLPGI
ncbi:ATP-binding protein [Sphingomonas sp. MS122]|uniref:ATP-binding protein n=1 Tax=Sphingomonas sp. MS122 TaxID=3412683 RepID=UPI003C2EEF8F